ncbi:hypothetical protein JL09_g6274 [Pichia kudriavzevii]|nr:hypothetical protein JL09_g6274 [Pichia kudriavzevii]
MTLYLQNGFNKWGQDIAQTGIGTYWNARQIMLEIWRRKNHNVKSNSWVDVLRDWKTNVIYVSFRSKQKISPLLP